MFLSHDQLCDLNMIGGFPLGKIVFSGDLKRKSDGPSDETEVSLHMVEKTAFYIQKGYDLATERSEAVTRKIDGSAFFIISCFLRLEVVPVANTFCDKFLNAIAEKGYFLFGTVSDINDRKPGTEPKVEVLIPGCPLTKMCQAEDSFQWGEGVFASVSNVSTSSGRKPVLVYEKELTQAFRSCFPCLEAKSNSTSTVSPRAASLPYHSSSTPAASLYETSTPVPKQATTLFKGMRMEDYHFEQIFYNGSAGDSPRFFGDQLARDPNILKKQLETVVQGAESLLEEVKKDQPTNLHLVIGGKTPRSSLCIKRALDRRQPYFLIDFLEKNKDAKLVVAVLDLGFREFSVVNKKNNWRADHYSSDRDLKDMCPEWRTNHRQYVCDHVKVILVPFDCPKSHAPKELLSAIVEPFEEIRDTMKDGIVTIFDEVVQVNNSFGSANDDIKGLHSNGPDYTAAMRSIFTSRSFCHWFEWNPGYYNPRRREDAGSQTGGFMIYHPDSYNSKDSTIDNEEKENYLKFVLTSRLSARHKAILCAKINIHYGAKKNFPLDYSKVQWIKFSTNPQRDFLDLFHKHNVSIQKGEDNKYKLIVHPSP